MRVKISLLIRLLPPLLLTLGGCLPPERSPVNLAQRIAGADSAILWGWAHLDHVTFAGNTLTQLVGAVSSARGGNSRFKAQYGRTLEFYKGTNLLATIRCQSSVFKTTEGEYADKSGMLKALNAHFPDELAKINGVNKLAAEVAANPELAGLQAWGERVVQEYEAGGFETNFERTSTINPKAVSTELTPEAVPQWLRSSLIERARGIYACDIYVCESPASGVRWLKLDWPASCILAVGPTNLALGASSGLKYLTNIAPGIYAYHE